MAATTGSILDDASVYDIPPYAQVMQRVASEAGKSLGGQLKDLMMLSMRGHRLTADEYYLMRLYEDDRLSMDDKRKFVGLQKSRKIWSALNQINPWRGMIDNKLVFEQVLRGFGLPTTKTLAIAGGAAKFPKPIGLDDERALKAFFANAPFPLFGKPLNSNQSLGSTQITAYRSRTNEVELHDGRRVSVGDFFGEISASYAGGYLFQACLEQHEQLQKMTGSGVATVRLVTLDRGDGPELFRAVIKLTGDGNVADNFWRKGNLLAPVDAETGQIGPAHSALGIDASIVDTHPVTGAQIAGVELPFWLETVDLAYNTAGLLGDSVLVGFDIAITKQGPVVVEANYDPHLIMLQIAHGKGVLDQHMTDALAYVEQRISDRVSKTRSVLTEERKQKAAADREALALKSA